MSTEDSVRKNIEGLKLYREGKYEEALKLFTEAIEIDPENGAAWLNRSGVYNNLGKEEEAKADREKWESLRQKIPAKEALEPKKVKTSRSEKTDAFIHDEEEAESAIPVKLEVDYSESLSRWRLFFKWLFAIPLYIGLWFYSIGAVIVTFIAFWAILFTGRFPRGMFDFVQGYIEFLFKVYTYFPLLMTDSWGGDEVFLNIRYPKRLSRLVLVLLKLPSFLLNIVTSLFTLVLYFLFLLAIPIWWIILVLGKYPRKLFDFNVRLLDWVARVTTWQYLLRDNWSLFGTTRPAKILVVTGLVLILAWSGLSFAPLFAPKTPIALWLISISYGGQGESVVTQFMEAGKESDIETAVDLFADPLAIRNEVENFILQNRDLFEDFECARCTGWEYNKTSGIPAELFLHGNIDYFGVDKGTFMALLVKKEGEWKIDSLHIQRMPP